MTKPETAYERIMELRDELNLLAGYIDGLKKRHDNLTKEHERFKAEAIALLKQCRDAIQRDEWEDGPTLQETLEALGKFIQYEWTLPNEIQNSHKKPNEQT